MVLRRRSSPSSCVLLALDLGVFHRNAHAVSFKEAATWSFVWVSLALLFNCRLLLVHAPRFPADPRLTALPGLRPPRDGVEAALQFLAGYVVEYSLSVDNIFVFVVVLNYFLIPTKYQHRVLFFGILGALVFRAIFIAIGAALMQYHWVIVLFGVFLVFTGVRMMVAKETGVEPERQRDHPPFRKMMPVTKELHEQNFFVKIDGRKHATPLFIALLFLEMTDIVFAVDSVPAIFALTREPLIVFTSNIFAILGLRNLYFMLREAIDKFHMLKYGLGDRAHLRRLQDDGAEPPLPGRPFPDHAVAGHHRGRDRRSPIVAVPDVPATARRRRRAAGAAPAGPRPRRAPQGRPRQGSGQGGRGEEERLMEKERVSKEITPKGEDYSQWYLDVVLKTELADYGPVKGCMVIRPYGYAVWEHMQADMDRRIKETGHVNAYFPLFIPKSFLEKEKEHVEGFSPECAWVTIGGGRRAGGAAGHPAHFGSDDLLDVREVGPLLARPARAHQPVGQRGALGEGHAARSCARRSSSGRRATPCTRRRRRRRKRPSRCCTCTGASPRRCWPCPSSAGRKSESEKFAGALRTYSIEALMGDGKALQAGTSHNLGQHFATAYGIEFLDKNAEARAALVHVMGHVHAHDRRPDHDPRRRCGTDPAPAGRALPGGDRPHPAAQGRRQRGRPAQGARGRSRRLRAAGVRVHLDDRDTQQPGFKYADWEMRGVPLRLEIGPKDIEKDQCVLVRRDTREKAFVPLAGLAAEVARAAGRRSRTDLLDARADVRGRQHDARRSYDEFKQIMAEKRGFIVAGWCRQPRRARRASRKRRGPPCA